MNERNGRWCPNLTPTVKFGRLCWATLFWPLNECFHHIVVIWAVAVCAVVVFAIPIDQIETSATPYSYVTRQVLTKFSDVNIGISEYIPINHPSPNEEL